MADRKQQFPLPDILIREITGELTLPMRRRLENESDIAERLAMSQELLWRARLLLDKKLPE